MVDVLRGVSIHELSGAVRRSPRRRRHASAAVGMRTVPTALAPSVEMVFSDLSGASVLINQPCPPNGSPSLTPVPCAGTGDEVASYVFRASIDGGPWSDAQAVPLPSVTAFYVPDFTSPMYMYQFALSGLVYSPFAGIRAQVAAVWAKGGQVGGGGRTRLEVLCVYSLKRGVLPRAVLVGRNEVVCRL